jgi:hypothetical protein
LNNEGTPGYDVGKSEQYYDQYSSEYVIQFYNTGPATGMNWQAFWLAPTPQIFPLPFATLDAVGTHWYGWFWYGPFPLPAAEGGLVLDPTTALPWFTLGLNAYLTLESLRNIINQADLITLKAFLKANGKDLNKYLSFLYQQYSIAVIGHDPYNAPSKSLGGIIKTATPSWDDLSACYDDNSYVDGIAGPGDPWNGVYGALATYPSYAAHAQWYSFPWWPGYPWDMAWWPADQKPFTPPAPKEVSSPSYFISLLDDSVLNANSPRSLSFGDHDWDFPWRQNKVILGSMARWKAIYLISGYDRVWQLIRSLQDLVKPYVLSQDLTQVPPILYLDDGTRADGNWSARELCNVLQLPRGVYTLYGGLTVDYYDENGSFLFEAYSVSKLLNFLYDISGLPIQDTPQGRPLSFRALLAGCDDESYGLPLTAGG